MPVIHANTARTSWGGPRPGSFRPNGAFQYHGNPEHFTRGHWYPKANPADWGDPKEHEVWSARLFVGFSIGDKAIWTMDDMIELVQEIRQRQQARPDASFVSQRGIYSHEDKSQGIVVEDGAQIIIVGDPRDNVSEKQFRSEMIELAEEICREFRQESVMLEIQCNGMFKGMGRVTP